MTPFQNKKALSGITLIVAAVIGLLILTAVLFMVGKNVGNFAAGKIRQEPAQQPAVQAELTILPQSQETIVQVLLKAGILAANIQMLLGQTQQESPEFAVAFDIPA